MTMKYLKKNISAEFDEVVVTDVSLNNGVLTFARKDFYSDSTNGLSILIDLKDIKLRIYKLKTGESLSDYEGDSISDEKKLRRETHLFLEPVSNGDNTHETEGIYHEYIWDEESKKFEMLGSTYLNLEPLEGRMDDVEDAIDALREVVDDLELDIKSLQQNKVDKELGKSLIETSKITKLDGIQDGANKTIVDTEIKVSDNPVSNTAIKNALADITNMIDANSSNVYEITDDMVSGNDISIDTNHTVFFIYSEKDYNASTFFKINNDPCVDYVNGGILKKITADSLYIIMSLDGAFAAHPITDGLISDELKNKIKNLSVVDVIEDGNSGVATSNAVYDALQTLSNNMELTTLDITYTNGNTDKISFYTKPKTSNGG